MKLSNLLIFVTMAATPAAAQRVNPDRVVDFHLNMEAQNQSFGGSVREGSRFNVSIRGEGDFAIVPVVTSEARQQLTISVLRIEGDAARTVETVTATVGEPAMLRSIRSTTVVVEGLRMAPRRSAVGTATFTRNIATGQLSLTNMGNCCVTCGSVTACACAVKMDCGSCCSDDCCTISQTRSGVLPGQGRTFVQLAGGSCNRPVPEAERRFTPARVHDTRVATSR